MKELRTEIEIDASPRRVWEILTDFDRYAEWNPFIRHAIGGGGLGKKLKLFFRLDEGQRERSLNCTITLWEPNNELQTDWKIFFKRLYRGEHRFIIKSVGAGRVQFIQIERFDGWLLRLFERQIDTTTRRGFEAMDRALKARAEARISEHVEDLQRASR